MIFTQYEVLTCRFWLVGYKGVYEDDANGMEDEWDGFQFWEKGSLGDSVAYSEWALLWSLVMTCKGGWPPQSCPRGGRCHSLTYETYGMKFLKVKLDFSRPKNFLRMSKWCVPSMRTIIVIFTSFRFFPFWLSFKITYGKGMFFLGFQVTCR